MAEHRLDEEQTGGLLARWKQTEPLRLWLYGIAVPLLAALVGYGLLTGTQAGLWLAVLTAALLGGGVEAARQYVVSPATARAALTEAAAAGLQDDPEQYDPVVRHALIRYRIPA